MLGMTIDTKAARGYVGVGPRYSVRAARGRGAARRGAREAAGPHVSEPQLRVLRAAQRPAPNTIRQQRVVFGGGGSVTESDAVEKVRTDSIRRERRSRIGSEQNLDESKGSLFQSFEHFRKARLILRLLIRRERRSRWG